MPLIPSSAISTATDYEIDQSLRFNDDDSPYLGRTPSSDGNRKTWTWSGWVKRGNLTTSTQKIFGAFNGTNEDSFNFNSDKFSFYVAGANSYGYQTANIYRDLSAFYHFVVAVDTTISSPSADRVKLYVNGVATTFGAKSGLAVVPEDYEFWINGAFVQGIGWDGNNTTYLDGYLAEVNFIDGQALTPADFGETGDYGEWKPIEYSGTYGTNGFYLPFKQDYTVEGFSTVTWKGTGANQYIGGTGFQPDLTWIKNRGAGYSHVLANALSGSNKFLSSNGTGAEDTDSTKFQTFETDGFNVGTHAGVNSSSNTYVAWNWDMGGSNASNTDGDITSTVRANPTYGQSIVSYTGNGTAGATVGHGLSSAPEMIMIKNRSSSGDWAVYHTSRGATKRFDLNTTDAENSQTSFMNDTEPTTSVFSLGTSGNANSNSDNLIAYCFHSVTGYSKFGSYTGNGSSTGTSVTTGFEPAFLMLKRTDSSASWHMYDNVRKVENTRDLRLLADTSDAEWDSNGGVDVDFNSTGFQLKTSDGAVNASSGTYIYMAFADTREYAYWLDQSGNNNDWTSNNLTESDISVDSPTNNFATFNPLDDSNSTLSEGNLKTVNGASYTGARATMAFPSSGKWYAEYAEFSTRRSNVIGALRVVGGDTNLDDNGGAAGIYWGSNGLQVAGDGWFSGSPVDGIGSGDVLQMAYDSDTGKVWLGVNNQWLRSSSGTLYTDGNPTGGSNQTYTWGSSTEDTFFSIWNYALTGVANFGQDSSFAGNKTAQGNQDGNDIGDFYYEPPTGYLALCTKNLPDVDVVPSEHFNTVTYSGTGSTQSITVGFQPAFTWFKSRSASRAHVLVDAVRGVTKELITNSTGAELTSSATEDLTAFTSTGFDLGTVYNNSPNESGASIVAWNWKANGSGSSNTDGSITSTVSANVDAGFSIVSYTGTGSNATVGHGLSSAPDMVIVKNRDAGDRGWFVYHSSNTANPETDYLYLNTTAATSDYDGAWNDTAPTNSLFSLGNSNETNSSGADLIAYCFHSVDGYSKVGSYTGNGNADGTFIYTGFRPAWVMIKYYSGSGANHWWIWDSDRNTYNPVDEALVANLTVSTQSPLDVDFTSNGFKFKTSNGEMNGSGTSYIYLAFAETPFKYSNAR